MSKKAGKVSNKQAFPYAKRGSDGKWYHWTALVAGKLAQGAALGVGFGLAKWLIGDWSGMFGAGFVGDAINDVKGFFTGEQE